MILFYNANIIEIRIRKNCLKIIFTLIHIYKYKNRNITQFTLPTKLNFNIFTDTISVQTIREKVNMLQYRKIIIWHVFYGQSPVTEHFTNCPARVLGKARNCIIFQILLNVTELCLLCIYIFIIYIIFHKLCCGPV